MNSTTTYSGAKLLHELSALLGSGRYVALLNRLRDELNLVRAESVAEQWRNFCGEMKQRQHHPVMRLLKDGPLGGGSGLIHEPLILDFVYGAAGVPPLLLPAAHALRSWELALGFCGSLRSRYLLFARELQELGLIVRNPRVLAVGCGHLREAALALSLEQMHDAEIVAFDRDRAAIDLIERTYQHPQLSTVSGSLRDFMADPATGAFDFIYVPTLFDTLEDGRVASVLDSLIHLLKPGGRLLAVNFAPELNDAAYLEGCLDWWPVYRTEVELAARLSPASSQKLRGQAMYRDDSGGSIFLDLQAI